jgi:excisionase family DNA binding protein
MTPKFLRAVELAKFLSLSLRTVRDLQRSRAIPYMKVGRAVLFDADKVASALEQFERKAIA